VERISLLKYTCLDIRVKRTTLNPALPSPDAAKGA
jgi:hypothetical protein